MATSKLQRRVGQLLDRTLPQFRIRENYRPDWLISDTGTRLELDFYIEEIKVAFEIQGAQHYQFIAFFHRSLDEFEKRKYNDALKKDLCYGAGVRLIEILTETDALVAIRELSDKYNIDHRFTVLPPPEWRRERQYTEKPKKVKEEKKAKERQKPAISTVEDKLREIQQYKRKVGKYGSRRQRIHFEFQHLTLEEQSILLSGGDGIERLVAADTAWLNKRKEYEARAFANFVKNGSYKEKQFTFTYLSEHERAEIFKQARLS
jgi:hypothetical protein